jgi:protein-S-isoprenylcysteine O-methyltransferase Ste14
MDPLYRQAILQGVFGLLFFAALVFGTAGTWHYWQGWAFLAVFAATTTVFTIYLATHDRALLERRMKAGPWHERERPQKTVISLILAVFFASIVLPVLDHRHRVSPVPSWVSIAGDAITVLSFAGMFWVIKTNTWAASNIRVEPDQRVVDTGPYAYVRHPMYAAALWLFVGIPLALGSWWSLALLIPSSPVLVWRLLDEERILARDLPGYAEYMRRVKHRLVPYVW